MINFGEYDQKVTFRTFQDISDGFGGTIPVWEDLLSTFARVKTIRAYNVSEANQLELPLTYEIGIQYRSAFSPTEAMRVQYQGKDLMIKSVRLNLERQKREYIITATTID
jgi:SPP1 family predicted phage head-tail adaptor